MHLGLQSPKKTPKNRLTMYPSRPTIFSTLFLTFCLLAVFIYQTKINEARENKRQILESQLENSKKEIFDNLGLRAQAFVIKDIDSSEIIYEYGMYRKMPLASLTKLMTAYVSQKYAPSSFKVEINEQDLKAVGDAKLYPGDTWNLNDIVSFAMVNSSNDAIESIDRNLSAYFGGNNKFVEKMNEEAMLLGLYSMEFFNATGLDVSQNTNGGYGSANDVASLTMHVFNEYPHVLKDTISSRAKFISLSNKEYESINTNTYIDSLSPIIASKTGYTNITGGNLVIIKEIQGKKFVFVVMGSTYEGRFIDMSILARAVEEYLPIKTAYDFKI